MQKRNLLTLDTGVNYIDITVDDLGIGNNKTPIAILPTGAEIHNADWGVIETFKSSTTTNQISDHAQIRPYISVGTADDKDIFLGGTFDLATSIGNFGNNNGAYFDDPEIHEVDTKIFLESWLSSRIWTMGGDMNTAHYLKSSAGTQNAAVTFAGYTSTYSAITEEYNGSSWSAGGSLSTERHSQAGCGSLNAAAAWGGSRSTILTSTEEYNGTSWSGGGSLNTSVRSHLGCGTQNAALSGAGRDSGSNLREDTEEYNGSVWAVTNSVNILRRSLSACGTQSAAVSFQGFDGVAASNNSEEYNGNVWSITNSTNFEASSNGGFGTQTAAVLVNTYVEEFDGTTWCTGNRANIIDSYSGCCGLQGFGLAAGTHDGNSGVKTTEEYGSIDITTLSLTGKMRLSLTVL